MTTKQNITKAIFPVAGLGTRFLPATKAMPKEMLPIVDKPLIQYAVEEAIEAGIKELIFVTSSTKRPIEDHFDQSFELEAKLQENNKTHLLALVQSILPKDVSCVYIRQKEALGLGHAVLCAKTLINQNEAFAVLLADDLIEPYQHIGCLKHMTNAHQKEGAYILATNQVPKEKTNQYGIVSLGENQRIIDTIEKPSPEKAPSTQAIVGRYILPGEIFSVLETQAAEHKKGNGEIQLTDAIKSLLSTSSFQPYNIEGKRYDCGSKLGYLQANLHYGLTHPELKDRWQQYLHDFAKTNAL